MPARKIPLVWKTQKESDQKYFKYDHTSQRVVQIGCGVCPTYVFIYQGDLTTDPGSGNFYLSGIFPANALHLSTIDAEGDNVSNWLSTQLASATTITGRSTADSSVFFIANRVSSTNNGTYWSIDITITSFTGMPNIGDTFVITYT